MSDQRELLRKLPPGPTLVHRVLAEEGELTQQEIVEESLLHPRTVRWALSRLETEGLVISKPNPNDARQDLYSLRDREKSRQFE